MLHVTRDLAHSSQKGGKAKEHGPYPNGPTIPYQASVSCSALFGFDLKIASTFFLFPIIPIDEQTTNPPSTIATPGTYDPD